LLKYGIFNMQGVPKRCIHKVDILYYNVYTAFWDTCVYFQVLKSEVISLNSALDMIK
jgi:hypothetical protein